MGLLTQFAERRLQTQEDARSLFRDQGGCTLVCDCVLSMGANAQMAESALQTLTLLSERERDAAVLLSHKRGKVLVQVLAWMQGLSANAGVCLYRLSCACLYRFAPRGDRLLFCCSAFVAMCLCGCLYV